MNQPTWMFILANLYISVPQCLASGLCALIVTRPLRASLIGRLAVFSVLLGLFSSSSYFFAMQYGLVSPRLIFYIGASYLLFRSIAGFDQSTALNATFVSFVSVIITTIAGSLVSLATGLAFSEYYTMHFSLEAALIWYPCWFALPLLLWFRRQRLQTRAAVLINLLHGYPRARVIFWVLLLQIALLTGGLMNVAHYVALNMSPRLMISHIAIYLFLFVSTLAILFMTLRVSRSLYEQTLENDLSEQVGSLLATVESQHEAFLLSLDELEVLASKGQKDELDRYLNNMCSDLELINTQFRAGNTLISALLNAKLLEAEKSGITMKIELEAPVSSPNIDGHTLEMIRILGNLLDNALDAVQVFDPPHKWIRVQSQKAGPLHCLIISNPLSPDASISDEIFQPGYTGKGGQHSGLGLYIAHSLARKLGGSLRFQIEPGPVVGFVLILPR